MKQTLQCLLQGFSGARVAREAAAILKPAIETMEKPD